MEIIQIGKGLLTLALMLIVQTVLLIPRFVIGLFVFIEKVMSVTRETISFVVGEIEKTMK
tara:strand:- start:1374 stop:1553 length:180 start_codon:yes stop_codon:yes gene_type:complete